MWTPGLYRILLSYIWLQTNSIISIYCHKNIWVYLVCSLFKCQNTAISHKNINSKCFKQSCSKLISVHQTDHNHIATIQTKLFHHECYGAPPWSNSSVLDHRSLPQCSNLGVGISVGYYLWRSLSQFSLPSAQTWPWNIMIHHEC